MSKYLINYRKNETDIASEENPNFSETIFETQLNKQMDE